MPAEDDDAAIKELADECYQHIVAVQEILDSEPDFLDALGDDLDLEGLVVWRLVFGYIAKYGPHYD